MLWTTWGQLISILFLRLAREAGPASHQKRPQVQPKPPDLSSASLGACGKERTGFPQVGGAYPSEIPHPVDPEIWKRYYMVTAHSNITFVGTEWCDSYWV